MTSIAILCAFVRMIARAVFSQSFMFGGKETGDGSPNGLPLIFRFSYLTPALLTEKEQAVNSILQWRTHILVNPARRGVHALSFPGMVSIHLLIKWKEKSSIPDLLADSISIRLAGSDLFGYSESCISGMFMDQKFWSGL
jgi:hypothetical protein